MVKEQTRDKKKKYGSASKFVLLLITLMNDKLSICQGNSIEAICQKSSIK